jgi:hypothetical protein
MYTPVNEYKLSKKARDEFELAKRLLKTLARRVEVPAKIYDEFVEAMPVTCRELYRKEFPVGDKVVVRG